MEEVRNSDGGQEWAMNGITFEHPTHPLSQGRDGIQPGTQIIQIAKGENILVYFLFFFFFSFFIMNSTTKKKIYFPSFFFR